ncbi:MAG: type II secretion system F family protein, partial [Elusimicrobiaceae bacterium]|nr:type II secretion system F family protein [Elusimicrobiaceae bacterium]
MEKFIYRAQDAKGKLIKGKVSASSEPKVVEFLQEKGYVVLSVKGVSKDGIKKLLKFKGKRVAPGALIFFSEQLSTLIEGGVPIVRAITLLSENTSNKELGVVLNTVANDLASGSSFSSAVEKHPKVFNNLWKALIQVGEVGGKLSLVLRQIAEYVKSTEAMKGKLITALTYPAILFLMAVGVLIFFIAKIVPTFANIFSDFQMDLPVVTKMVLGVSSAFTDNLGYLILGVVFVVVAINLYLSSEGGKRVWHGTLIELPIFGNFVKNIYFERMLSTLSTMLKSGVTILNSIAVLEDVFASNVIIQEALIKAKKEVSSGKSLSESFEGTNSFPKIMTEMMLMGEESGKLPDIIETLASFYEEQVNQFIARFSAIIDPI